MYVAIRDWHFKHNTEKVSRHAIFKTNIPYMWHVNAALPSPNPNINHLSQSLKKIPSILTLSIFLKLFMDS